MKPWVLIALLFIVMACVPAARAEDAMEGGKLVANGPNNQKIEIPLAHTAVDAQVAGFVARVTVTQTFVNPSKSPIEAVYVFPLPQKAAVDDMTMKIGQRVVKGVIKKREEAKQIYDAAKAAGKTASLLDQERPNIFTQSVANIMPGDNIEIQISYVDVLKYEGGEYEFVFPMVVGPRYIPGEQVLGHKGGGWAPDTDRVPDASRITPPVLKPGERSGHDIEVTLRLDAGLAFADPTSPSHWIKVKRDGQTKATVTLDARDRIPNKDLIVRYNVRGKAPAFGAVTYSEGGQGYFLLLLAPKAKYDKTEIIPREVLFVVDSSGSQSGDPLAKSKDVVKRALKALRADDTFQVFNFNDVISSMAAGPVPATAENVNNAKKFIDEIKATGGTRMLPAVQAALNWPADPKRLRILVMTTDGYIGNETEILAEIHKSLGDARLFMFGCGSSVNRYLIDRMAEEGRGYASYVRQDEAADKVIDTFAQRLDAPVLRDLDLEWKGLAVADVYPAKIPDLYAGQPVTVFGRFTKPGAATIELRGKQGNGHVALSLPVNFPNHQAGSDQLASLWARARIEKLMSELEVGVGQRGALENEVTDLGLRYRLMTQFTSFVAVEEQVRNVGGQQQTVQVPVEMPEGVSYEGVFGSPAEQVADRKMMSRSAGGPMAPPPPPSVLASPHPGKASGGAGYGSGATGHAMAAGDRAALEAAARFNLDPVAFLGVADPAPLAKSLREEVARKLDDALKGAQLPTGKSLMIKLTLKADGRVDAVEIMKDEAGSAELAAKIKAALLKAKLTATGGKAEVIFFLHF